MMKRLFFTLLGVVLALTASAQEKTTKQKTANDFKKEGDSFLRNKQKQQALDSYLKAISMWADSSREASTYMTAAKCATELKELELAQDLYSQCKDLKFQVGQCEYEICMILKAQGRNDEYEAGVKSGFEKYKTGKIGNFFMREYSKIFRDKAYATYKEGLDLKEKAKRLPESQKEEADKLMSDAKAKWAEAKKTLVQALEAFPNDIHGKSLLQNIEKEEKGA